MIPWRKAARYAIKNGEWPIWNPFILSGDILASAAQPAVYHPIHVAAYLLPLGPSLTFSASAVFFLAGLCSFVYLREVGCREPPAIIAAAGWMFCQFMLFWTGWPHTLTVAVFPLVLLAARRIARAPNVASAGLLTVALTLVLLGGHPESMMHCVAVGACYGLCELALHIARLEPNLRRRAAIRCLAAGLSAGVLAFRRTRCTSEGTPPISSSTAYPGVRRSSGCGSWLRRSPTGRPQGHTSPSPDSARGGRHTLAASSSRRRCSLCGAAGGAGAG